MKKTFIILSSTVLLSIALPSMGYGQDVDIKLNGDTSVNIDKTATKILDKKNAVQKKIKMNTDTGVSKTIILPDNRGNAITGNDTPPRTNPNANDMRHNTRDTINNRRITSEKGLKRLPVNTTRSTIRTNAQPIRDNASYTGGATVRSNTHANITTNINRNDGSSSRSILRSENAISNRK